MSVRFLLSGAMLSAKLARARYRHATRHVRMAD